MRRRNTTRERKKKTHYRTLFSPAPPRSTPIFTPQAAEHAAASELSTPLEGLRTQIEALEAARARVVAQLQQLQSAKDASGAAIGRLLSDTLQYKDMLAALQQDQSTQVPRTRHFLTLYAIISAIKCASGNRAAPPFSARAPRRRSRSPESLPPRIPRPAPSPPRAQRLCVRAANRGL